MAMDREELADYAVDLIFSHATDVEFFTIWEAAEGKDGFEDFTEEDARVVEELIQGATLSVTIDEVEYTR